MYIINIIINVYITRGKNRIRMPIQNENLRYKIYDTGDADLDGRYCVALPTCIDPKNYSIRARYNLF